MIEALNWLLFAAAVIVIGCLGQILFRKTSIADIVLLMLIGLAIGPLFNLIDAPTIGFFKKIVPFFAALTFIIILFEGGLKLNFQRVVKAAGPAFGFTLLNFALSVLFAALVMHLLGWNLLVALMLGTIIGGTSSAIIIPLVNSLQAKEETKTLLSLESALTDALCIVATIAIIQIIMVQSMELSVVFGSLLGAFSIAGFLGFVFALYWIVMLRDLRPVKEHQYMLTIAMLFFLYIVTEFAHGNGAISALVFGLVLGNAKEITLFLKMRPYGLPATIGMFHKEMSFFVRTFFFIYIGIIFELQSTTFETIAVAIILMTFILAARIITSSFFVKLRKDLAEDRGILQSMGARGLAAAVLASYPAIMGAKIAEEAAIIQIAFLVILFSNITTTVGVLLSRKKPGEGENPAVEVGSSKPGQGAKQ